MLKKLISSLHRPSPLSHKGGNGKLMIIAGSAQYHGAAVLAVLAARRFVDIVRFYPAGQDPFLIQAVKTIPEVIVDYNMAHLPDMDAVLVGNGIGEINVPMDALARKAKRLVIDADGFRLIRSAVPAGALLTPHEGEFRQLFGCPGTKASVASMARNHRCVILKKDPAGDIISDGKRTLINTMHSPGMTKGGTGDVLAGLAAAFACKNDPFTAAVCAAHINGLAGKMLEKKLGYNFCASDLANQLGEAYYKAQKSGR